MRRTLKIIGIVIGLLVGVLVVGIIAAYVTTEARLDQNYDVKPGTIEVSSAPEVLAEGERLASIRGCTDCHGSDLGGKVMISDPAIGTIFASNLTSGEGGVGQYYADTDYLRAIRHGVDSEGHGLLIMPSAEYFILSDEDAGALIAYIKSLPPVDRVQPGPAIGPLGRVLFSLGQLPPLAAEIIDHDSPRPSAPEAAVSEEFGAYLATSCIGCHGQDFAGGPIPGAPPDSPESANLTPSGNLGNWTLEDFVATMRSGVTPEGKSLDPSLMPWPIANAMTDVELKALWTYLNNLEPIE
jgi:mono/diheme cytochrome c family protein